MVEVKVLYHHLRENIANNFDEIFTSSVNMASKVEMLPSKPRSAGRQQHRANADSSSVKEYYLRNLAIPFLDHIIMELEERFSPLSQTASNLFGLVPSVQCNDDIDIDLMPDAELYKDDLPSPELVPQELKRWKLKCKLLPKDSIPLTCAKAIKMCDPSMFPNICTLLKIACALPVTSCECERSASTLRRFNTFMRANMKEERLFSMALIHTNYNMPIDLDKAVDIFLRFTQDD